MSAALTAFTRKLPRRSRTPTLEPLRVRILEWCILVPAVCLLGALAALAWGSVVADLPRIGMWLGVVIAVEFLPVLYSAETNFTLSMPLLLAAGMILAPIDAGLIGFFGSWDMRRFRRGSPRRVSYSTGATSRSALFSRPRSSTGWEAASTRGQRWFFLAWRLYLRTCSSTSRSCPLPLPS